MTDDEMPVTLSDAEYDAIEAAVMETERGRWFLREYAKRNRNADTEAVLAALGKVEAAINGDEAGRRMDVIRAGLLDMARSIARTRQEMGLAPRESDDLKSFVDAVSEAAGPDGERECVRRARVDLHFTAVDRERDRRVERVLPQLGDRDARARHLELAEHVEEQVVRHRPRRRGALELHQDRGRLRVPDPDRQELVRVDSLEQHDRLLADHVEAHAVDDHLLQPRRSFIGAVGAKSSGHSPSVREASRAPKCPSVRHMRTRARRLARPVVACYGDG